jgi:hypothetical protein
MSYQLHAPTDRPDVLALRAEWRRLREAENAVLSELDRVFPTAICRICKTNGCGGSLDYTVCAPCWNAHNGKPPPATETP